LSITAYWADQPVPGAVPGPDAAQPVAPVFQAAFGMLGEVGPIRSLLGLGEVLDGGDGFRAEQQDNLGPPGRDHPGELVDQVLRRLPAGDLEHRAGGAGADAARHRARVVVGAAERRPRPGRGVLELANPGHRVDRAGERSGVSAIAGGVRERGPGGVGG
jgi:hypothetical protein